MLRVCSQIFCSIRKTWVAARPEEIVRQQWIQHLTQQLGFPVESLALERELRHMPHLSLSSAPIPIRRADLVAFARGIHSTHEIYPLLVLECKAVNITAKTLRQLIGYNFYLKAPFIAVVNQTAAQFGWYDEELEDFKFIPYIPRYLDLMDRFVRAGY